MKFLTAEISNFYLGTPLNQPEYACIKLANIPQEFCSKYNFHQYEHTSWIYFEITKGIYGLKQAGKLANDLLTQRLEVHGYYQCTTTPGMWHHTMQPIMFVLIVNNFGIEYVNIAYAKHLLPLHSEHITRS